MNAEQFIEQFIEQYSPISMEEYDPNWHPTSRFHAILTLHLPTLIVDF
jgi:hypothetical protein